MSEKYIRHVGDGEFDNSLFFNVRDRQMLYTIVAGNIKFALREILLSMSRKYAKLAETIDIKVVNNGIEINMAEYAKYLDLGTKGRFMMSHVGKKIPIKTKSGKTIIRKVTAESVASGKWYNPGIKAHNFVEHAIEEGIKKTVAEASRLVG